MAYLVTLYDTMLSRWGACEQEAAPLLESALELLDFESAMPLDTYLWPSKCKVAWGAGELLRVLVERGAGTPHQREQAYQAAERTAIFTFLDNQLADGRWSSMHYPLSEEAPQMAFSYKPLKGTVWATPTPIDGSPAIFLPPEEITGEFLGEMASVVRGVEAMLG